MVLKALKPDEEVPYFFAEKGPDGKPLLLVDKSIDKLGPKVKSFKPKCQDKKRTSAAVVRHIKGKRVFVRDGELPREGFRKALKTLASDPQFKAVKGSFEKPAIIELTIPEEPKDVAPITDSGTDLETDSGSDWESRKELARKLFDEVQKKKADFGDKGRLTALIKAGLGKHKSGDEAAGLARLDEAIALARAILASEDAEDDPVVTGSLVAIQRARLLWDATRKEARKQLAALGSEVQAAYPDDETVVERIVGSLDIYDEAVIEALDRGLNAEGPARAAAWTEAAAMIEVFEDEVADDELLAHLDDNEWMTVGVQALLGKRLAEVRRQLEL